MTKRQRRAVRGLMEALRKLIGGEVMDGDEDVRALEEAERVFGKVVG